MNPELAPQLPEVIKDEPAIKEVISKVKSQGLFDQFRKECIADVDTKPAYHNLLQRVESYVEHFLQEQKWSSVKNKNQLRENLRRQLNNSGMMHNGVERIIEQVVNPKILLGIKPKIDEAVCDHLGIDLKARQEEQQRKKQEQQRLLLQHQQQLQQQNLQSKINQKVKPDDGFDPAKGQHPMGNMGPWGPGMANIPTPSVPGVGNSMANNSQCMVNFPGMMPPFSMMGGWGPGFNPAMQPMIPGQPMIPAFPGPPPTAPFNANISSAAGSVPSTTPPRPAPPAPAPVIPDLSKPPPGLPNTPMPSSTATTRSPIVPPRTASITPAPPGSVPPPPGTVPVVPPASSSLVPPGTSPVVPSRAVPTTPTIPALISHTLAKVSEDKLTPEKIAVFKTAAAFITKTVSNAQGTPGADLATMFSPRVLAEAMMEESGKPMTKHEIRAARRKERLKEIERLKAERDSEGSAKKDSKTEDKEDPLPPKHNLMDVFQGAEDVSDDEEALDLLMDIDETEDKNKSGIILSDESDKEGLEQPPTSQPGKRYNFAWDVDINPEELSDVTISSIHTSDISSFEEDASSSTSEHEDETEKQNVKNIEGSNAADKTESMEDDSVPQSVADEALDKLQDKTDEVSKEISSLNNEDSDSKEEKKEDLSTLKPASALSTMNTRTETVKPAEPKQVSQPAKPRKLLALSSHYSDSDDDETREERRARIAKEKEERYLKRQQRRAELEAKRKEREEERARLKEEKKRQKELAAENKTTDFSATTTAASEGAIAEDQSATSVVEEQESTSKTPTRKRKNKAELKEQLLQQKVMERKAALRRRRTRNRRYASDEFTTIFSERKTLNQSYTDDVINPDELVTFDSTVEVVEMTVDQECVVETVSEVVAISDDQGQASQELVLQCPSPYSDISDRSMSDKSDLSKADNFSIDKVSSEEELEDDFEDAKPVEEMTAAAKEEEISLSHSAMESDEAVFQQDGSNSVTMSEPISPRSRISTHSKSVLSQDELENTNSIPDEKSSQKSTGASHLDEDKESQISLNEGVMSPIKTAVSEIATSAKPEEKEIQGMDVKVASPKDIMADLELEPVSDEDSSLGAMSDIEKDAEKEKEEGEEKDSDGEMASSPEDNDKEEKTSPHKEEGVLEDDNASDEGEIKSDSEEEVAQAPPAKREDEIPRLVVKKPIEFVDFGEAEKRARESRVFYSESDRRRTSNVSAAGYRGGYTPWQTSGSGSVGPYPSGRYGVDTSSPVRSKSPGAAFDAESEASSHSRSSVRVRDNVPPPYPIEGVSRKHKTSTPSTQSSSGLYKPVSPPSPVSSSSSSSRSRHSRSRSRSQSRSRSRSRFSSRSGSSDSFSSGSRSSSRKRKRSKRKRKRKRQGAKSRSRDGTPSLRSHSPSSRLSFTDRPSPPHKMVESPLPLGPATNPQLMQGHLSSGNESISSDELPYFPDEEAEKPTFPSKLKHHRLSRESSFSNNSSHSKPDSPGKASISSSELIYSPTRKQAQNEDSDGSSSTVQKSERSGSRRKSSSRHSASSIEDPASPRIETGLMYSPHRPSSPTHYPLLPDDMSGFQPPLPEESPDHPPLPCNEQPPLPPLPPSDSIPPPPEEDAAPLSPPPPTWPPPSDEVEEGECPSSPEYEEHLPGGGEHTIPIIPTVRSPNDDRGDSFSNTSTPHQAGEDVDLSEDKSDAGVTLSANIEKSSDCPSTSITTPSCSFQSLDSKDIDLADSSSTSFIQDKVEQEAKSPSCEETMDQVNENTGTLDQSLSAENEEKVIPQEDSVLPDNNEMDKTEENLLTGPVIDAKAEVQPSLEGGSPPEESSNQQAIDNEEKDVSDSSPKSLKRSADEFDNSSEASPPSKRQKEAEEEDK